MTAFCAALLLLLIAVLIREERRHRLSLAAIPLRIHVNGTRGKSGVTRLIAAGLRAGGIRTFAKVTGTAAKTIAPDGTEQAVARRGPANIREYLGIVREAAVCGAQALVMECMALQPDLQAFCERRLMRSHIGVVTNIRRDHEEIMGWTLPAIAASLGRTVPADGVLVATPQTAELLRDAGRLSGREGALWTVDPAELTEEDLTGFDFAVERDNVALALGVCELAGVDRGQALAGMRSSQPDSGNLTVREYCSGERCVRVIDALAANDPDSTRLLWDKYVGGEAAAILLHTRADRRLRTRSLCSRLAGLQAGPYYLTGDTAFAARCLREQGVPARNLVPVARPALEAVLAAIAGEAQQEPAETAAAPLTLFACGNRKGFAG